MKKVLVVDDSPTVLKITYDLFTSAGFDVITAVDGNEAMEKAVPGGISLIVMDVLMPKMNGFQVCRKIKKNDETKDIPIILLTSKDQKSDKFWGLKQGADAYLTKPFAPDELLKTAQKLMQTGS